MLSQRLKRLLVIGHDIVATALAVVVVFYVRFDGLLLETRLAAIPLFLPPFVIYASVVYRLFGLYRAKWRFASLPDLSNIVRASAVLALTLLIADYILLSRDFLDGYFFGKIAIAL